MSINSPENIAFSLLHKAGCSHKDLHILANFRESSEEILQKFLQKDATLIRIFGEKKCEKITKNLSEMNREKYENFLENECVKIISFLDENFPKKLKEIFTIPFLLYTKGKIELSENTLAIVGSRKNTNYGLSALQKITENLPKNLSIISGGAYGIDTLAHEIALEKNLHTIAVFGCGINVTYPKTNSWLFEKILQNGGGIISIFPIDTPPDAYNFPIRNEIVAGLSDKILIPEASEKSGTLITARLGNDLGKEIFAVPWDIFRATSSGCNELINRGEAFCTLSWNDLFPTISTSENLTLDFQNQPKIEENLQNKKFASEIAETIFREIADGNNTIDLLFTKTKIETQTLAIELTLLEISGDIRQISPGTYACIF